MGGGQYSFDVAREARTTRARRGERNPFDYSGYGADATTAARRGRVHPLLDVRGQGRECMNDQAVVVALDVTRSRGDDAKVVYEKLPTLIGWLVLKESVGPRRLALMTTIALGAVIVELGS